MRTVKGCEAPRGEDSGAAAPQPRSLRPAEGEGAGRKKGCEAPRTSTPRSGSAGRSLRPAEGEGAGRSRKTAQYFARLINGNVTIIVKNGFMLIAAIVPVIRWADEKAVQFMRDAAGYAAVAFQRRQSQGADLGENEE